MLIANGFLADKEVEASDFDLLIGMKPSSLISFSDNLLNFDILATRSVSCVCEFDIFGTSHVTKLPQFLR